MGILSSQAELLLAVETKLDSFFQSQIPSGAAFNAEMARYHFSTGGKRLRALIPLWVYEACGQSPLRAIHLGCALEMIHNATLVHDDLQDGDVVRRGKPTVWKHWSPAQAINCGDALFEFSVEILTEMDLNPALLIPVIRKVKQGTLKVIEGQAQEFLMKDEPYPSESRYLKVIEGKTGALIATAVASPLMALGKSKAVVALAEDAAMQAGVLFQLQDDLLDLYGNKGRDRVGSDIAEGKVSALIAAFYDRADEKDRVQVRTILQKPREETTDADIGTVLAFLDRSGAKRTVVQNIQRIRQHLKAHPLAPEEPAVLKLIQELMELFLEPIRDLLPAGE